MEWLTENWEEMGAPSPDGGAAENCAQVPQRPWLTALLTAPFATQSMGCGFCRTSNGSCSCAAP